MKILTPARIQRFVKDEPSFKQKVGNLVDSAVTIVKAKAAGESPVFAPDAVALERKEICLPCPNWNPAGNAGLGKCKLCGCSQFKLDFAALKCPIGKWGPYKA